MTEEKMSTKRKINLLLIIILSFWLIWSLFTAFKLHGQKKVLLSQWQEVHLATKNLSDILPNFIYLGKTIPIKQNPLLTQLARIRLDITNELKASDTPWNLNLFLLTDKLIIEQAKLSKALQGREIPTNMIDHIKALQTQWKLRQDAYDYSGKEFKSTFRTYHERKHSLPGYLSFIWDRD